jgi:molecular chaperone GrpE (heat shock protein)
MHEIEDKVAKNRFEYLEIVNKVDNIKTNLERELAKAKEVVVHEVKTSSDIVSVLDDLSDISTGK